MTKVMTTIYARLAAVAVLLILVAFALGALISYLVTPVEPVQPPIYSVPVPIETLAPQAPMVPLCVKNPTIICLRFV